LGQFRSIAAALLLLTAGIFQTTRAAADSNPYTWQVIPSQDIGGGFCDLEGISVVSDDDIWAVGHYSAGITSPVIDYPLVERWDGTQWTIMQVPALSGGYTVFTGVAALSSTDVWAVGAKYFSASDTAYP